MGPTVAGKRRALAGPEERFIDLLLWDVAGLNFGHDRVDERDFRFKPGLQADDQSIAQRDGSIGLGRRDVDFLNFIGSHRALNDSAADRRAEDKC